MVFDEWSIPSPKLESWWELCPWSLMRLSSISWLKSNLFQTYKSLIGFVFESITIWVDSTGKLNWIFFSELLQKDGMMDRLRQLAQTPTYVSSEKWSWGSRLLYSYGTGISRNIYLCMIRVKFHAYCWSHNLLFEMTLRIRLSSRISQSVKTLGKYRSTF